MNWLTRLIPSIGSNNDSTSRKSKVPDGLWNNCPACEAILYPVSYTHLRAHET